MTGNDSPAPSRLLTKELVLSLYVPALVISLGIGIITPVLPTYARSFGISFGEASLLFVIYQLGALAFTFPTGFLMDRIGRRPVLLAGPLITALASFLMAAARSYPEILICRFVSGAANELWMQSRLAVITDSAATNERGRQITWMVGMQRAGTMLGPAVGGFLADAWDIRIPFIIHGILMLAVVIPSFIFVRETVATRPAQAEDGSTLQPFTTRDLIKYILTAEMLAFFVVQFLATVCRGGEGSTFNLYAVYEYGIGPQTLGLISVLAGVAALPIPFITGYFMDRYGRKKVIVPSFTLLASALLFMAVTAFTKMPLLAYVVAYIAAQVTQSTTNGTMQVLGSDMSPAAARGGFFGVWRTVSQGGALFAPAIFAVIAEHSSFGAAFLFLSISSVLVAIIVSTVLRETGRVNSPQAEGAALTQI